MTNYLIKLIPITPFFFGGENTFGEGKKTNYFARSNYLPQQTTLLGMLRHELLIQNGKIDGNPREDNWSALIGPKSFMKEVDIFMSDFGAIHSISPLFIIENNISYVTQAMDWAMYEEEIKNVNNEKCKKLKASPIDIALNKIVDSSIYTHQYSNSIPVLTVYNKAYNPKLGLKELWVSKDGTKLRQYDYEDNSNFDNTIGYENGFFVKKSQVGIHRDFNNLKDNTGNFYKQDFYQFKETDTCFAFYVELDETKYKHFDSTFLKMGGENSMFSMIVEKIEDSSTNASKIFINEFTEAYTRSHPNRINSFILLSDAFLKPTIFEKCFFAISDSIPFRNISTNQTDKGDYASLSKSTLTKSSELLYLVKRGSILYTKNGLTISDYSDSAFEKIGYNQFLIIN